MKNLLSLLMLCFITQLSIAQNMDYYNRMNHVFGTIDKSKVTTGLLKEFGVRLNHVENYAGSINSTNYMNEVFIWMVFKPIIFLIPDRYSNLQS